MAHKEPETRDDIEKRVVFEIALRRLAENHRSFDTIAFKNVELSRKPAWSKQLAETLSKNDKVTELDLTGAAVTDATLTSLVPLLACGGCPQLRTLQLADNQLSMAGETMVQGLRRMRPALTINLGSEGAEGFVHQKLLVEGLTSWPAESLAIEPGSNELRCPPEIVGSDEVVMLKKGFSGTNGVRFTCDDAEFEMMHSTSNLVLKRLEPEARLRLATRLQGGGGTLV